MYIKYPDVKIPKIDIGMCSPGFDSQQGGWAVRWFTGKSDLPTSLTTCVCSWDPKVPGKKHGSIPSVLALGQQRQVTGSIS